MAPDLNTVPKSPRHLANGNTSALPTASQTLTPLSRRTSTQMPPPPLPQNNSLPNSPRPATASINMDNTGVGMGPGPIRHPRPLTAAELHLEVEKEQESIVNRLTRELSALRAQTASVASTTSSTSDHFLPSNEPYTSTVGTGTSTTIIPTSTRRHRSSSNLSARSARSIRENLTSTSVSGVAAPREQQSLQASSRPSMEISRPVISRQNSTSAMGYRGSGSPYAMPHRQSSSSTADIHGNNSANQSSPYPRSPSFSSAVATARYEEAALQRAELESVKRENEILRARVKELEKSLAVGHTSA